MTVPVRAAALPGLILLVALVLGVLPITSLSFLPLRLSNEIRQQTLQNKPRNKPLPDDSLPPLRLYWTQKRNQQCPLSGRCDMDENDGKVDPGAHQLYEIRLKGHLDEHWSEWFDDLSVTYDQQDNTILSGQVTDQSALHGLLKKVHNLGLPLIAVSQVESGSVATRQAAPGAG